MARMTASGGAEQAVVELMAVTVCPPQVQHHGIEFVGNLQFLSLGDEPGRILGTGQFLFKGVQAKAVVDALVQNAAQFAVAL